MRKSLSIRDICNSVGGHTHSRDHGHLRIAEAISLRRGRIHEVMGDSADVFAVIAASRLTGPVVWVGDPDKVESLAPTALQEFFDPARVILTVGMTRKEILWAGEQAMRAAGIACVVMELRDGPDLRISRRLQIVAERSGCTGIVLISGRARNSVSQTRWECVATHGAAGDWEWRCIKNRQGRLGAWQVQWSGSRDGKAGKEDLVRLAAAAAA